MTNFFTDKNKQITYRNIEKLSAQTAVDMQKRPAEPLYFEVASPVFFVNIQENIICCIEMCSKNFCIFAASPNKKRPGLFRPGLGGCGDRT